MQTADAVGRRAGRGGVQRWIAVGLVAAVIVAAGAVAWFGRSAGEPAAPATPRFNETQALNEIERLEHVLASAASERRDPRPLAEDARQLAARYPQYAPAQLVYAKVLIYIGDHVDGYQQLERALALDPRDAETHRLAGSIAMKLDQPAAAQRHYSQAVGLEPQNAGGRVLLATAMARQERVDDARKMLLEALRLDASLHQAHFALAELYAQQNRMNLALDQIGRAIELMGPEAPQYAGYVRRRASYLRRANQPADALTVLRSLPAKVLVDETVSDELAQTFMMLGRPDEAAHHYEQILFLNPLADWAAERAAHYRLRANEPALARQHLETLRRIDPRSPRIPELQRALSEP